MNKKLKFKGSMKQYMRWPLYLSIVLVWLDILIFMVSVKAGVLATLGLVVYIAAALLLTHHHRPLILNDLIAFANQYESLEKRLLDDLALPYAIMDTNGRMIWSNRVFATLTGKDQLYKKHISTIFPEITSEKDTSFGQTGNRRNEYQLRRAYLPGFPAAGDYEGCGE